MNPPAGGGTTAGGGIVTIMGSNFTGATAVNFGNVSVTPQPQNVTATSITVAQPPLPVGFQNVTVTTSDGTSPVVMAGQYLVDPIQITITNDTGLPANTPIYVGIFAKMAYEGSNPVNIPLTATGTAVMSGTVGAVGDIVVQDAGSGYAPPVTITPSAGATAPSTPATAVATNFNSSGGVTTLALTNQGVGYGEIVEISPPPTKPSVIPDLSAAATYSADINASGAITQLNVITSGNGYRQWFTFGTGSDPAYGYANVDSSGAIITGSSGLVIEHNGSSLTGSDTFSFPGSGTGAVVTPNISGGTLQSLNVLSGGSGYFYAPTVTFAGGNGQATATPTVTNGSILSMTVGTPGAGYGPSITIANGTNFVGQAVVTNNIIMSISAVTSGSGYAPVITFTPPPSGKTATAYVTKLAQNGGVVSDGVVVGTPGSGYVTAPTVTLSGNGGMNASFAATGAAQVSGVTITNPGTGYSIGPGVTFTGGGPYGAPATGTASVTSGGVSKVAIGTAGTYFGVPTVAFDAPPSGGYTEQWVGFNTLGQFDLASTLKQSGYVNPYNQQPEDLLPTYQLQFLSGTATLQMPKLYTDSVRIVFGVNSKPILQVVSDGSVAAPNMENPTDPNQAVFWDFVEYTLNQSNVLYMNTSAVDQFGIPLSVTVDIPDPNVPGGVGTLVTRDTVFNTSGGVATSFANYLSSVGGQANTAFGTLPTIQGNGSISGSPYAYRLLAPQDYLILASTAGYTGQQPAATLTSYFDSSLQSFYNNTSRTITLVVPNPNAGVQIGNATNPQDWQRSNYFFVGTAAGTSSPITFTGTVNGNSVQLTVPAYTSSTTPTTDAFAAKGIFAPGDTGDTLVNSQNLLNNLSGNIKNQIVSAVNRGINNVTPTTDPTGYGNYLGRGVTAAAIANGGSGYTYAPSVTFSAPPAGPNAAAATGIAVLSGDSVSAIIITNPGNGYDPSHPPTVSFSLPQNTGSLPTAGAVTVQLVDTTAWVGTLENHNQDHLPFYLPVSAQNTQLGYTPSNYYAGYFHATIDGQPISKNNKAYSLPYDDQGNQSSLQVSAAPESIAIKMTTWGSVTPTSPTVVSVDTNPPQVGTTPTPTTAQSVTWTVTFSEPVKGVTTSNFTLVPGGSLAGTSITSVTPNSTGPYVTTWTVTANTGTGNGTLGLNVTSPSGIVDQNDHTLSLPGGKFVGQVYSVNRVQTTASITRSSPNPTSAATVQFTVTFSQAVTGLTTSNFTTVAGGGVTGASVQSISGSGTTYMMTVNTGTGSGTLALQLNSTSGVTPAVSGLPVTSLAYTIDKHVPVNPPTVQSINRVGATPTSSASVLWTVTFSEPITGLTASNFALVVGGGLGGTPTITGVTPTSTTSTATWTVTASSGTGPGTLGLNMTNSTGVHDAEMQAVTGLPSVGQVYTIEAVQPTVSISLPGANPTGAATVLFTVTFSSAVTGLTTSNFATVAGGGVTGASVQSVTGSGTTYTVTVNTGSGSGTLALTMANSTSVTPTVTGLPVTSAAYTIDKHVPVNPPTVQSINRVGATPTSSASVSWTMTFSEPVTGLTASNFSLVVGGGLGGTPTITGVTPASTTNTATWTVTASTGAGAGTLGLNMVNSTGVRDAESQAVTGLPAVGQVYTIDRVAPALVSIVRAGSNPTAQLSVSWTITFTKPVSNVSTANFLLVANGLSGARITQVAQNAGTGTSWTVTALAGSGNGTLGLNMVNATGITDALNLPPTGIPLTGQVYTIQRGGATIVEAPISFMTTAGVASRLIWMMPAFTDADSVQITAILAIPPNSGGTLRAASRPGVTVSPSNSPSAELQFAGTVAALNAYFRNRSGFITYTPTIGQPLTPRTLTLAAQGSDGLGGMTTAALLVRSASRPTPAPAVNAAALLEGRRGQPVVITYNQLVTATGATQTTSRSIQFMLAGLNSGRLEVWTGSRWAAVPRLVNIPLLAPGGQIRWTPPAGVSGIRPAFTVRTWDGWSLSGLSRVRVNLR